MLVRLERGSLAIAGSYSAVADRHLDRRMDKPPWVAAEVGREPPHIRWEWEHGLSNNAMGREDDMRFSVGMDIKNQVFYDKV